MSEHEESPWTYLLVRTRDGAPQGWVTPASNGSWARRLDMKSNGSHVFHLGTNPEVWSRMRPARRTLVVCYNREPVYAGVIWSAKYDRTAGTVTLTHEDVWSLWERRFAGPHYQAWESSTNIVETEIRYSDITRQTMAKRIIQLGLRGISGYLHSYELPVILPADEEGLWGRTFRSYTFTTVAEWLNKLAGYGGPMQVDFPMEFTEQGEFKWRLQVSHESSVQTHLHPELDGTAVRDLSLTHDMSDFASELQVTGAGQDVDTLHRYLWLGDVRGDLVATAMHHSDGTLESIDEILDVRDGLQQSRRVAAVQADVTIGLGGENGLSPQDFMLGQQVHIHLNDDPVIPRVDGGHAFMLIGYTPQGPGELKLELAPIDGFTGYDAEDPTYNYRNLNASRTQDLTRRVNKAEMRLVYPPGGTSQAASTETTEVD